MHRCGAGSARLVLGAVVILLGAGSAGWAGQAAPPARTLEARIQALEDINAIRNVLLDYGRFLDGRDLAGYANLFAEDGEWVGGFGTVRGRANIEAFMKKNLGGGTNESGSYHLLSNFTIDVQGDTATASSRWTFIVAGQDGRPQLSQAGRYDDRLVRENGQWKIQRRVVSNDIPRPRARS